MKSINFKIVKGGYPPANKFPSDFANQALSMGGKLFKRLSGTWTEVSQVTPFDYGTYKLEFYGKTKS